VLVIESLNIGVVLRWDSGQLPLNLGLAPPPPNITAYRCKKEHSVALTIHKNAFMAMASHWTPLGELMTLLTPPSWLGRMTPLHLRHLDSPAFGARH